MIYFIATIEGTLAEGLVRLLRDNCYILRLRVKVKRETLY